MGQSKSSALMQCGRRISEQEIVQQIGETVELFARFSPSELVPAICRHLEWYTAAGGLKEHAKLVWELEVGGLLKLPEKQRWGGPKRSISVTENKASRSEISPSVRDPEPMWFEVAEDKHKSVSKEYIQCCNAVGYKQAFGYRMRYFVAGEGGRLGCVPIPGAGNPFAEDFRGVLCSELRAGRVEG